MDLVVTKVDLNCESNNAAHRTREISVQRLIVRRGQPFCLTLKLSRPFRPDYDTLLITAETGPQSSEPLGTRSVFSFPRGKAGKETWSAELDPASVLMAGSVTLAVTPPADAPVGQYFLFVQTQANGIMGVSLGSLLLLFNPWCQDDWVYLGLEQERQEYVMKEQTIIYRGTDRYISGLAWDLGQFENDILDICLKVLDVNPKCLTDAAQDFSARCNPIYVSRVVSAMMNCNDDRGVLLGNWSSSFEGGVCPTQWSGSVDILRRWLQSTCSPVKYGQCWVFAGTMCTVLRCLGIPCRVVTNFQSAHDTDGSLTVDELYGEDGVTAKESGDSVWNYHVWVEAWMRRPDLSDEGVYDGWQVVDPTPQEKSSGVYCCGPSPVRAIQEGHTNARYDVPFVFAEVNADRVMWLVAANGSRRKIHTDSSSVGVNISTKSVGSDRRLDITDSYKQREGTTAERAVFNLAVAGGLKPKPGPEGGTLSGRPNGLAAPGNVEMKVVVVGTPVSGTDIKLTLTMKNQSGAPCCLQLRVNVQAMKYTGTPASLVQTEERELRMLPGQELTIPLLIPVSRYGELMLDNNSLRVSALATDQRNPKNVYMTQTEIVPKDPALTITTLGPAQQYRELIAQLVFMNPLNEPLTDCVITVTGSSLLEGSVEARLPVLNPGNRVRVEIPLTPSRYGPKTLVADFDCNSFRNVKASCRVDVAPYNPNGRFTGR